MQVFPGEIFSVGVVGEIAGAFRWGPLIAPGKTTVVASACGVLPFFLGGEPVGTTGGAFGRQSVQPCDERECILITDVHRGLVVAVEADAAIRRHMVSRTE